MSNIIYNSNYSREIGVNNFVYKVTIINADKPFLWVSQTLNPIYTDNRMNLGNVENRGYMLAAMEEIMDNNNLNFDGILGTSTAGIPWGAILAKRKGLPFYFQHGDDIYKYEFGKQEEITAESMDDAQNIVANIPFGMVIGAGIADNLGIPFLFVRPKPKDHGKKLQVEGVCGEKPALVSIINVYDDTDYLDVIYDVLAQEDIFWSRISDKEASGLGFEKVTDLTGLRLGTVEDLVSTGGSYRAEVEKLRSLGAIAIDLICCYHYELPVAIQKAEEARVTIYPVLTYKQSLIIGAEEGFISEGHRAMLEEWIQTQPTWGDKYFPTNSSSNFANGELPIPVS